MFSELRRHESPTGALLAYHHQPAEGAERGILIVCHGLAEHSRRYQRFAEAMAKRGYHTYVHDHRGHGETTAPDAPRGQFSRKDGIGRVIGDVMAMRDLAASAHPRLPIILFGHSMGGLISLNTVVTHPEKFSAVAVWNSNLHPGFAGRIAQLILRAERMLKGSDVPSGLLPKLTFGVWGSSIRDRRTNFDWLSRDPSEVDKYIADPLCGFDASTSLWLDIFELSFRAPQTTHLGRLPRNLPIHLVGGGQDPATDGAKVVKWLAERLKSMGFSHVTAAIYPGMRHETLNEIGADRAMAEFADWCDRAIANS
ncbi:alpha/beta hydrolase [Neorhizobium sp. P12A]|uniref:alpha/beta hydrolase n=1 Tax=Neorhizobium sp. P12A TaxID=2268027 RepID=UPI0011EC5916|nr:alpha/beta hydrolase [Neorhizobium sp. P12A]KAA0700359.1 alpha/beta hydrolase [Neorhizobium sp. P12A]